MEKMKMNKKMIEEYAKKYNISVQKARRGFQLVGKLIGIISENFNPYDTSVEDLTKQDILILRTHCAEVGLELTPQEITDTIEIIKTIRNMLRNDEL